MKTKRAIKLIMSEGHDRSFADAIIQILREHNLPNYPNVYKFLDSYIIGKEKWIK